MLGPYSLQKPLPLLLSLFQYPLQLSLLVGLLLFLLAQRCLELLVVLLQSLLGSFQCKMPRK